MAKVVILGGGISGLCAARILAERGKDITIVEKEKNLGGLLSSTKNTLGQVFDKGTHFISETTIPELNKLLFADLDFDLCESFTKSMKVGSYFFGVLSADSDCINARSLPGEIYHRGVVEMLNCTGGNTKASNMKEFCLQTYGRTFTEEIFLPVVKKLANLPLSELDQDSADIFAINRLVIFDREATRELKKIPFFDNKVAWAHRDDGKSSTKKWYSQVQGAGALVSSLEKRIRADGTKIISGAAIKDIEVLNGLVRSLTLDNGEVLYCDQLIWTIPPVFFLGILGVKHKFSKPAFRRVHLFDFSIDTELQTDLHCVVNFDPKMLNSRITLFPNITNKARVAPPHHFTVEVISDRADPENMSKEIFSELKEMKIILEGSQILWNKHTTVSPGWPIIDKDFKESSSGLLKLAEGLASNVNFIGRGKGGNSHFMFEVLEDVYKILS